MQAMQAMRGIQERRASVESDVRSNRSSRQHIG